MTIYVYVCVRVCACAIDVCCEIGGSFHVTTLRVHVSSQNTLKW